MVSDEQPLKFDSSTCSKMLILADIFQLINLAECAALFIQNDNATETKNLKFSL
jgi:hypothetical protein